MRGYEKRRRATLGKADVQEQFNCCVMPLTIIDRLERRFGRFAIPNLTTILVVGQAILWFAAQAPEGVSLDRISLDPSRVMAGEVWRLVTFLFMPPPDPTPLVILYFLLIWRFGTTLERQWSDFRFNLFVLLGWSVSVIAAFAASALVGRLVPEVAEGAMQLAPIHAPNAFLFSSIFLAFARLYPDFILQVFFVLPVRIKWLALLMWLGYGYGLLVGDIVMRMLILATIFNYVVFFGREHVRDLRQQRRKRTFQSHATKAVRAPTHKCRVCGVNSGGSPRMAFRYCSKCAGQACYCPEHIGNHEHVTAEEPAAP
jgi:hypothetical protein